MPGVVSGASVQTGNLRWNKAARQFKLEHTFDGSRVSGFTFEATPQAKAGALLPRLRRCRRSGTSSFSERCHHHCPRGVRVERLPS